ncbi:ATP-binding protein [Dactylosporangium salmoneum]|uniref:ATP-binding protein n=1 Tax=Dactylosporangium salmoneum TaxID=53361 RepID=A0ABN3FIR1_9ACTN
MTESPLIASLQAAVEARPGDAVLRLHLAALLLDAGRRPEAIAHVGHVLTSEPANPEALALMRRCLEPDRSPTGEPPTAAPASKPAPAVPAGEPPTAVPAGEPPRAAPARQGRAEDPLAAYERELEDLLPPRFSTGGEPDPVRGPADRVFDVEAPTVRLADVGGMAEVKQRLELAFLGPMQYPELRRLYGKSLRGGLLLYGPPGCGKTFLARAVAGELGAQFMSLSIVDVLDMWIGSSERNLHELFEAARRNAPCVLFLDEIDALGHKRGQLGSSAMRTLSNQLLAELDGLEGDNEGVFVLAATNAPWDVDPALRRPGRLDRIALVLPPDGPAREAILRYHVRERPIAGIDLPKLVAATAGFSGADLAHLCESAAELAMADSIRSGEVRMIEQRDFDRALPDVRSSTGPWFATARNVALFANEGGAYDDLVAYLKRNRLL